MIKKIKIGEICEVKGGKRLPKGKFLIKERNSHPYIRVRDLGQQAILELNDEFEYVDDETFETIKNYITNTNDLLISIVGTVGLLGIVGESLDNASLTENCVKLVNFNESNSKYLYYYLKSRKGQHEIDKFTVGAVQKKLPIKNIREIEVELLPKREQEKVVEMLSVFDEKIRINNLINKSLEELAQELYKHWFLDFEFPDNFNEPYKSNGGEMISSELGLIPKGWSVKTIKQITKYNKRGFSPAYNENEDFVGEPIINQRCVRNHTIIEEAVRYHDSSIKKVPEDKYHKKWDVLINSMGVGTLGRVAISSESHNKIIHSVISILRPNVDIILEGIFSYSMLNLENLFVSMGEGTTGQTSLSNKYLGEIKIVVPPIDIQERADHYFKEIQKAIDNNHNENRTLEEMRDLLLPLLMSGKIRIPVEEE